MSITGETPYLGAPAAMSVILDRLTVGVLLVDKNLRVVEVNAAAREILAGEDGLIVRRGILRTSYPPETHMLMQSLMAREPSPAAAEPSRIFAITRPSGARPLQLVLVPLPEGSARGADAALFVSDPTRRSEANAELLRIVYGLTQAEARLARLLGKGERLDQAAHQLGITVKTARTHLKRILSKTDTDRQADLIRLLLQGVGQIRLCLDQPVAPPRTKPFVLPGVNDGFRRALT